MTATKIKPSWWTSDEWATPRHIVREIERQHGTFTLDACCRKETAKATRFYTKADDGLAQPWRGRVWVNPPYSNPRPWCEKAIREVKSGRASKVVMLLPAAVDTHWFHDCVLPFASVHFIRGRIGFLGWQGTPIARGKAGNILAVYKR